MRLICPHCQQSVTLPDAAAGVLTPCPNCGQAIIPPALTGAAIDAAPETPPPAPVIPASRERERPDPFSKPPVAHTPGSPATARPWLRLTLRRDVAHWIAPVSLVVVFLLTFCTWVAVAPNGSRVYTQNAWQIAGRGFTTDPAGEAVMHEQATLDANSHWNGLLLIYLILLIVTIAVSIADRVLTSNPDVLPDVFRPVWPYRQRIVAGLCLVLLLFLFVSFSMRVGLESAAAAAVSGVEPPLARDVKLATYGLERTVWLKLAALIQFIALVGIGMAWWLDRHPAAADVRIEVYC